MFTVADIKLEYLAGLLERYDLRLQVLPASAPIEGSFWGEPEAGIVGRCVNVRGDTPVHSLLHETAHLICMDGGRRSVVHRDAGGDDLEEAAVCYLQIVLADELPGVGARQLMQDMDAWGYSFRLGSTARWFAEDAGDARGWLLDHKLLEANDKPTFCLRQA